MKISTKGRYALRFMLDVASHQGEGVVRIKDVAQRQEISPKYLEQVVSLLVKTGLVRSVKGPNGGYRLTKEAHAYKVMDILIATEGCLAPVDCLMDSSNRCNRSGNCVTLRLWKELYEGVEQILTKYTLQDLVDWQKESSEHDIV